MVRLVCVLVCSAACSVAVPAATSDLPTPPPKIAPAEAVARALEEVAPVRTGPDWVVTCPERADDCAATAARTCPAGYLVLDDRGRPVTAVLSGVPPTVTGSRLHGRCVANVMREDHIDMGQ
jgi:hypothetical protein